MIRGGSNLFRRLIGFDATRRVAWPLEKMNDAGPPISPVNAPHRVEMVGVLPPFRDTRVASLAVSMFMVRADVKSATLLPSPVVSPD